MGGLEFEIRCVSTIENCLVSLPLSLIQTLQQSSSSSSGFLPHLLTLELRSLASNASWIVAWSGDTSSSSFAIEVSQQYAECIALPNGHKIQVRVVSNIPKATLVTIEPLSEDDWEVMELNSEHAEGAILKQVRVLHESMRFPLWLHGRTVITFRVASTFPGKSAVQLVAGTEVAVAPKLRLKQVHRDRNHSMQASCQESQTPRALLRVQDQDMRLIRKRSVKDIGLGIVLTSIAFVHPESAKNYGLDSHHSIVIIPSTLRETNKNHEKNNLNMKNGSGEKEVNGKISSDEKRAHHAIVRLLLSASVAKGHIMISHSLRAYLGASLHSWVHVRRIDISLNKNVAALSISPACFKPPLKDKRLGKYRQGAPMQKSGSMKNVYGEAESTVYADTEDLSTHDKVVNALSYEQSGKMDNETDFGSNNKRGLQNLLREWFLAHLDAVLSSSGEEINSLILGSESLLHFEVKHGNINSSEAVDGASNGSLEDRDNNNGQLPRELLFLLGVYGESIRDERVNLYELVYDESINGQNHLGSHGFLGLKLDMGDPISLKSGKDYILGEDFTADLSALSWMQTAVNDVVNRLTVFLSAASVMWFSTYALPLPGHVLIYGPPGSGKTLLARSVAKSFESRADILAHIVFVRCSKFSVEKAVTIRDKLSSYISEALDHAPSVLILDDLDSIISSSSELEGAQPSTSVVEITEFLTDLMDEYGEKRKTTCGVGPVAFIATVRSLDKIPQSLSSSGRFDFHVQLPAPSASEREALLKLEIQRRALHCPEEVVKDIAFKSDGYDAYDLEVLIDRTIHASLGRFVLYGPSVKKPEKLTLLREDFSRAMHGFLPVAMREISKSGPESARSGWDDVGGLTDICNAIKEMIELPSKFPNVFARAPLRLRSNVLLYGPPGCGKTHIVGAAASACSLRFISVKGPELLNKYIGASEQAVRDIFSKAAAAAPCLLFFDEFDSIAPKRGHDNTGVTDRVVNQFLTELDGVEVLTGVFVFAATSRPDLLDAALLRPGRLDRLLFCDFPARRDRLDILTVLSRKLPLGPNVDLDAIASMTDGFSGADLQALLSDAQLAAVHYVLDNADGNHNEKMPVITDDLLKSIASKARPSVSEAEKQRLYSIYSQFLDSKRSVAAQSRDAKGKRATLA